MNLWQRSLLFGFLTIETFAILLGPLPWRWHQAVSDTSWAVARLMVESIGGQQDCEHLGRLGAVS